ncbi:MAG: beta-lactamase family protein, partial [Nocardioides sp.]|nr:beta-lactamase family protein [Nocardioides sp.]
MESLEHSGTVGEYAYNSADFLVLGAIVESVTGRPYVEVLRDRLITPLGMKHSAASAVAAKDLPPGHRLWWGRAVSFDPDFDESGTSYASVTSMLDDLAGYARAKLGVNNTIPRVIRAEMQRPHVESSQDHYGLGWSITDIDGVRVVHHTGATPGYFTHVLMVPEEGTAIVMLANAYGESRAPSLARGAQDVWRISKGEERDPIGGDALLTGLPWIMTGLAVVGLLLGGLSRRRPRRRLLRIPTGIACLLVAGAPWTLPGLF